MTIRYLPLLALGLIAPLAQAQSPDNEATAILAGGCFWCVEADFEKLDGVISAVSGYTGGHVRNPTYKQVTHKDTGHYEAVKITYDSSKLSYNDILDHFWTSVDPTDPDGQFCDKGPSYRTAIFATPEQMAVAQKSRQSIIETKPFREKIVTPILPATRFYTAEDYHQDYYKKNPIRYTYYRSACRRDKRLKQLWGKR